MAEQSYGHLRSFTTATAVDISGTTAVYTAPVYSSVRIAAFCVVIKTVTAGTNVVTVKRACVPDATTGAVTLGTFTVPAAAAGNYYKANVWEVVNSSTGASTCILSPGEAISFTPAGSSTGAFYCGFLGYEFEEPPTAYANATANLFTAVAKHRSGQGNISQLVFTAA